jgi:hypothetical protein
MKKIAILICSVVLLGACAGMDYQYQRNMAVNATGYGLAGAAAGAAIASVTHGNVGQAATIGTVAGAILGAANTPPPPPQVVSLPQSQPSPQYPPPAVYPQPPVVYGPPAVAYAYPPVVYAPAPVMYIPYIPPIAYGGYYGPYCGFGGLNVTYFGGSYGGGYGHHGYGGGYYRHGSGYGHR